MRYNPVNCQHIFYFLQNYAILLVAKLWFSALFCVNFVQHANMLDRAL